MALSAFVGRPVVTRVPSLVGWGECRVGVVVLAALVGGVVLGPLAVVTAGAVVAFAAARASARRQRSTEAALAALATLAQLTAVGLAAGLGPPAAFAAACRHMEHVENNAPTDPELELDRVVRDVDRGRSFGTAVGEWARRQPLAAPLAVVLADADRTGVAVGAALETVAEDLRLRHRRHIERRARRLPISTLAPLILCILPAFVLLTVVPLLAAGLGRLAPLR